MLKGYINCIIKQAYNYNNDIVITLLGPAIC